MTLPADVPTSLVQGTYSIAEADNADTGIEPQGAPLDGLQIVLTPDPPRVWTHTSSGAGVAIGPMLATTNSMGVLVNPVTGLVGLRIPSSAQAGLTGAPTIPWTAEISDPLGRVETERKTFHAPAGGTVNLPSVAPYWPDPNAGSIPQWEKAVADAGSAALAALAARIRSGKGRPTGSAPLGTLYIDTRATYGATVWQSTRRGTSNVPEWLTIGADTGSVDIRGVILANPDVASCGSAFIRRSGEVVTLACTSLVFGSSGHKTFYTASGGWEPNGRTSRDGFATHADGSSPRSVSASAGAFRVLSAQAGVPYELTATWLATSAWPSGPPA